MIFLFGSQNSFFWRTAYRNYIRHNNDHWLCDCVLYECGQGAGCLKIVSTRRENRNVISINTLFLIYCLSAHGLMILNNCFVEKSSQKYVKEILLSMKSYSNDNIIFPLDEGNFFNLLCTKRICTIFWKRHCIYSQYQKVISETPIRVILKVDQQKHCWIVRCFHRQTISHSILK